MFELIRPGTHIDFIGKRMICAALSVGLLLVSAVATFTMGPKWGIDFAGGTEIQVHFEAGVEADEGRIREVVSAGLDLPDASVVRYGEPDAGEFLIKFRDEHTEGDASDEDDEAASGSSKDRPSQIEEALAGAIGALRVDRVEFVGPRVGAELRSDGVKALLWASLVIFVYIAIRFSSRFAPGAIIAVLHDLLITAGIFVILQIEFDLRILAAMLAILGYSLNDTIIIFDRVRENMGQRTTYDLPSVLNQSVNQTLSRTVLTSGTTLMALLALFFLGGEVIRPFAFAMLIGVVVGTYSSVYIAAPTLLFLERRFGD